MSETNNTQERGLRKTRIGVVVSDKMDKTVTIQIKTRVRHPLYGKIMNHPAKLNMGDCFTYACARAYRTRIAYKGDDFSYTDLGWQSH